MSEKPSPSSKTLAELLAALPEEERFVMTLHYINGRSADEIAKALGVPTRAVESVIASGKSKLLGAISKN